MLVNKLVCDWLVLEFKSIIQLGHVEKIIGLIMQYAFLLFC